MDHFKKNKQKKADTGGGFKYRHIIDPDVAQVYADRKCKHCQGRGCFPHQIGVEGTIRKSQPVVETLAYCECVYRNAKRYN